MAINISVQYTGGLLLDIILVECRSYDYDYDSITVSSAWELTSVHMRYSQGDGVHTSLS